MKTKSNRLSSTPGFDLVAPGTWIIASPSTDLYYMMYLVPAPPRYFLVYAQLDRGVRWKCPVFAREIYQTTLWATSMESALALVGAIQMSILAGGSVDSPSQLVFEFGGAYKSGDASDPLLRASPRTRSSS